MTVVNDIVEEIVNFCKKNATTGVNREVLIDDFLESYADEMEDEYVGAITQKLLDHDIEVVD